MIVVTAATGKLGNHVIEGLLKTVPANEIIAAVRTPSKAQHLAALGVQVREADYFKPETLKTAFAGANKLLLISSNDLNDRIQQHKNAIDAAMAAGITQIAYTSLLHADTSGITALASSHKATEGDIIASGIPYTILRNGWYLENHTENLAPALEHGALLGAAKSGRFASASRADYASAAVAVLANEGHTNKIYELGGDTPYTLAELAAEVTKQFGKQIVYNDMPAAEYEKVLLSFHLPTEIASMLALADECASKGQLDNAGPALPTLIGRRTTPLADAVALAAGK